VPIFFIGESIIRKLGNGSECSSANRCKATAKQTLNRVYYYALGQASVAIGYCTKSAQNSPENHTAWSNAGWAAIDNRDYGTAKSYFGKAEELFYASKDKHTVTQELDLAWGITVAAYCAGDKKQARDLYRAIKKTYPDFVRMSSLKQLPLIWSDNTQVLITRVYLDFK
jgi:tetratricopeptide (TPR) repeat protein